MKKKYWYILAPFAIGILVFLDQITKYLARRDLIDGDFVLIDGVFKLHLLENKGAVWGMFQNSVDFLSIVSIIMTVLIVILFIKIPEGKKYVILRILCISVCAGAIGNLIDRIAMGGVTDFLYIELINFPIFNVADCYITFAMVILLILVIFYYKEDDFDFLAIRKKKKETAEAEPVETEVQDEQTDR